MEPLTVLTHISHEYENVVSTWLFELDFELVHIRHLAWHSLSFVRLAKEAGAKVVKSFHDFYAVCPTVNLLDDNGKYCEGACTDTPGDCSFPLWENNTLPRLKKEWVYTWRENFRKEVIAHCDAFVTTHDSAKEVISRVFEIPDNRFHVISHGRDFKAFYNFAADYKDGDVLKILVPGNIGQQKGANIIEGLVELDKGRHLHFHILGRYIGSLRSGPGVTLHGTYSRDDFAEHVREIRPHIGAVLSVWNETWCHTLTELWSVGLPVIVTNYPTLKQRVDESGAGWVVEHDDIPFLYTEIINSIAIPQNIKEKVRKTRSHQNSKMKEMTTQAMAEKYKSVYGMGAYVKHQSIEIFQGEYNTARRTEPKSSHEKLENSVLTFTSTKNVSVIVPLNNIGHPEGTSYIRVIVPLQHPSLSQTIKMQITDIETYANIQQRPRVILVQRDAIGTVEQSQLLVDYCIENHIKLVYEIDDDLFHLPKSHSASARFSPTVKKAMKVIVKNADAVVVSTEALKNRLSGFNTNIIVLPNALDERLWDISGESFNNDEDGVVRILYMGTRTHDEDLAIVTGALNKIAKQYGEKVTFTCIGGFANKPLSLAKTQRPPVGTSRYPAFVKWMANNRQYDIAIAPLVDNEFNRHKSYIKYLDYGICGFAPVLSNVQPYRKVVRHKETGLLVENTTEAWFEALSMLIEDSALRKKLGENAREDILTHHTLAAQSEQRIDVWETITS